MKHLVELVKLYQLNERQMKELEVLLMFRENCLVSLNGMFKEYFKKEYTNCYMASQVKKGKTSYDLHPKLIEECNLLKGMGYN